MFDYAAYEKACAKAQEKNEEYLDLFEMELIRSASLQIILFSQ